MSLTQHNIVLDIDATLLHTQDNAYNFEKLNMYSNPKRCLVRHKIYHMNVVDVTNDPGTGNITCLSGVYRPYLKEFIDFCFEYFNNVIIWSAGKKKYVEECCRLIFPIDKPAIIYSWDDCDYREDGSLFKPLSKIWEDESLKHLNITEKNTFHLDDRDDVYGLNKENGVKIPEFECEVDIKKVINHNDEELIKFMLWLSQNKVKECKDIRNIDKKNIFDKSCDYYEDLINTENSK